MTVSGCGEHPEDVAVHQAAFAIPSAINFSKNGTSIAEPRQSEAEVDVGMRIGYGNDPHSVVTYNFALANDGRKPWARVHQSAMLTMERPSRVWMVPPGGGPKMTVIGTNIMTNLVHDTFLGAVFPAATQQELRPVGPIATLSSDATRFVDGAHSANTVFALMSNSNGNLSMHHAYLPTNEWADFPMPIGTSPDTPCGSGKTPYTSPQAIRRKAVLNFSQCQDSVVYGCGATSPAQACEYRIGGASHARTYFACFGSGSTFIQGTRPVAFADAGRFSSVIDFGTGERWIFAAINASATQKRVVALRETSAVDSAAQPTYAPLKIIDTQSNTAVLSSPMPIMYKDQNNVTTLAVFYLRKIGANTTRLVEAKTTDFNNWSVSEILDTRVNIPAGNEPTPHYQAEMPGIIDQLRVQFRLPVGSSQTEVRDTVEVIRQPNGTYVKTILPPAYDSTNLYVVQNSSATLYQVDKNTGLPKEIGTGWSGVTAFATDGIGLGYAVKGADLWEINLNDNVSRKIGSENWTNTTHLAFGYHQSFGLGKDSYPRLWAIRSNVLRRVDLATGVSTSMTTYASGVKAIATYYDPSSSSLQPTLYVIDGAGTLFFLNTLTGVQFPISATGAWAKARAMTTNPVTKHVYIAEDSDVPAGDRVYRLNQGGTLLGQSNGFSNPQWMATIKGVSYLMKSRQLHRIGGTGSSVTVSSFGSQIWDYSETGMVGRNH